MNVDTKYVIVDGNSIDAVVSHLKSIYDILGFDTETDKDGNVQFIQIYSPIAKQTFIFDGKSVYLDKLTNMWSVLQVVGHNIQFDLSACLKQYGSYPTPIADTFLLACSLQEGQKGLKPLCSQYFEFPVVSWENLFGDYDYVNMSPEKWQYMANDPYYTYILLEYYHQKGAYAFVKKAHEMDIKAMLQYMEASFRGILIDKEKFNNYLEQYTKQVDDLQVKLNEYAGWEVRTTATRDLRKLLFEQMELPTPPITTEKGEVSVSKEALSYVEDKDGIVSLILQIKEAKSILASMQNLQ